MRDLCLGVLVALLFSTLEVCGAPLPKVDKDTKLRWAHFLLKVDKGTKTQEKKT